MHKKKVIRWDGLGLLFFSNADNFGPECGQEYGINGLFLWVPLSGFLVLGKN